MSDGFPTAYTLDADTLRLNAYRLLCLFYANREIARLCDPDESTAAVAMLERRFFWREMTQLLLNLAIGLRVLDDQMRSLSAGSEERQAYSQRKRAVNQHHSCMLFDEMTLRDTCNKIIHALVVEPHTAEGETPHQIDECNWIAWSEAHEVSPDDPPPKPEPIRWKHLSGHIRLGGRQGTNQWWHLLEVPTFVDAIYGILDGA